MSGTKISRKRLFQLAGSFCVFDLSKPLLFHIKKEALLSSPLLGINDTPDPLLALLEKTVEATRTLNERAALTSRIYTSIAADTKKLDLLYTDDSMGAGPLRRKTRRAADPLLPYLFDSLYSFSDQYLTNTINSAHSNQQTITFDTPDGKITFSTIDRSGKAQIDPVNDKVILSIDVQARLPNNSVLSYRMELACGMELQSSSGSVSFYTLSFPRFYDLSESTTLVDPFENIPVNQRKALRQNFIQQLDSWIVQYRQNLTTSGSRVLSLSCHPTFLQFFNNRITVFSKELPGKIKRSPLYSGSTNASMELFLHESLVVHKFTTYINSILPRGRVKGLSINRDSYFPVLKIYIKDSEEIGWGDWADIDITVKIDLEYYMRFTSYFRSALKFDAFMKSGEINVEVEDAPTNRIARKIADKVMAQTQKALSDPSIQHIEEYIDMREFNAKSLDAKFIKEGLLISISK